VAAVNRGGRDDGRALYCNVERRMRMNPSLTLAFALFGLLVAVPGFAQGASATSPSPAAELNQAYHLFYSGHYQRAAEMALELRTIDPGNLEASELRTSALHFQIKRALGPGAGKSKAFASCAACPELFAEFMSELRLGQAVARARLQAAPEDETATFFLGKLDLNYVWLQSGTLGRKTGWDEYWEARKSLDAVLKKNPTHIRAKVARAWIDYIVDTKMPLGTGWLLGGGNKKQAFRAAREAALAPAESFATVEAVFAMWDMHVREKNYAEAVPIARQLAVDFPENQELVKFLTAHDAVAQR
jgi:tetratricopeptide (TPR) repeat protein